MMELQIERASHVILFLLMVQILFIHILDVFTLFFIVLIAGFASGNTCFVCGKTVFLSYHYTTPHTSNYFDPLIIKSPAAKMWSNVCPGA